MYLTCIGVSRVISDVYSVFSRVAERMAYADRLQVVGCYTVTSGTLPPLSDSHLDYDPDLYTTDDLDLAPVDYKFLGIEPMTFIKDMEE